MISRELIFEWHFTSAHKLDFYDGKCKNLHGHTWKVLVRFRYHPTELQPSGLSIDFHDLKDVLDRLDHTYINDVIGKSASAENILEWLVVQLQQFQFVTLLEVRLWESDNASVRYSKS